MGGELEANGSGSSPAYPRVLLRSPEGKVVVVNVVCVDGKLLLSATMQDEQQALGGLRSDLPG